MGHDVSTGIIEFILDHFTEDNEGTYTCQITDGGGKGQSSLVLIGDGKLDKIGIMRENLSWIPKSNLFSYAYMRASECLIPWNDVYLNHVKEALGNITLFFFMNCDSALIPGTLSQAHPKTESIAATGDALIF